MENLENPRVFFDISIGNEDGNFLLKPLAFPNVQTWIGGRKVERKMIMALICSSGIFLTSNSFEGKINLQSWWLIKR